MTIWEVPEPVPGSAHRLMNSLFYGYLLPQAMRLEQMVEALTCANSGALQIAIKRTVSAR